MTHGKINSREEIKKKKILSDKTYEQAIGFLRIQDAKNILDETSIHPESYNDTNKLLKYLNISKEIIGKPEIINILDNVDKEAVINNLKIDSYTLNDIIESLKKPNREPSSILKS